MSTPRITGSSSSSASPLQECETAAVTSPATGPAPRPQAAPEGHSLEAFRDQSTGWETPVKEQAEGAETSLAALKAERHEQNAAATALREGLEGPMAALASKYPEPEGLGAIKSSDVLWGSFGKALDSDALRDAVATLPRETAETLVRNQVGKSWPGLSGEQVDHVTAKLMGIADDKLRDRTAFALRDVAVGVMNAAANDLTQLAKDPAALKELAMTLEDVGGRGATKESKKEAAGLREALGLDTPSALTRFAPELMAERINARAALVREEANGLGTVGAKRVASELLDHDVGETFLRAAKLKEGSWAATQVASVKVQGKEDREDLKKVELVTALATCAVTGGLAMPAVAGLLVGSTASAVYSLSEVGEASRKRGKAAAGESAGTMAPGAHAHAELEYKAALVTAAFKAVPGVPIAHEAGHLISPVLGHIGGDLVSHLTMEQALEGLSELAVGEAPEGARGLNAAQQANVSMAVRTLHDKPEARAALRAAMDQAGLPNDDAKAQALQGFLASQGRTLGHLSADEVGSDFTRFVKSQHGE